MSTGTQVEVVMPQMGVSVSEGTITRWLKQQGETVSLDEPLLEISTDKVDTEIPSPGEGILSEIRVQEGETVEVGSVLAVIGGALVADVATATEPQAPEAAPPTQAAVTPEAEPAGEAESAGEPVSQAPTAPLPEPAPTAAADVAAAPLEHVAAAPEDVARPELGSEAPAEPVPAPRAPEPAVPTGNGRSFISPVVARIASEHGVDPDAVVGTGQGGRVTKKDILSFIETGGALAAQVPLETYAEQPSVAVPETAPVSPEAAPVAAEAAPVAAEAAPVVPEAAPPPPPAPPTPVAPVAAVARGPEVLAQPGEFEEPMNAMRRGIAEHMRRSLDTSAHVTSAIEVDMSRVVAAREHLKQEYQTSHGVNPTYLAFVAKAAIETLEHWPWINGELRGEKIITRSYVNVGIAVSLEEGKGLIVPVIRNAQDLNLLGIARAIADVAERARTKKLMPDDVQGGTFTITNPGGYGTFHGTPVISQPQSAILGTYALVKRPWVVQDELGQDVIAIRPLMNITLTYDHRLVDGAYSGGFLHALRERLEDWDGE